MNIKVEGDPGTGNTFMEINIQHVEHFYPTASSAPINNNGTRARKPEQVSQLQDSPDTASVRSDILAYVNRLRNSLADEWKSSYHKTWEAILDMEVVSRLVYNPGKQQGTNFNRSLVANIICYLSGKGVYGKDYNASHFAEHLEGDKDHSVRGALGRYPSDDIVSRLDRHFE